MIVYEKNNKLNINFENELDNPDIEIGKGEIKLGESEITANSVLPVPEEGDAGKVPTVQDDGSYALADAGGSGGVFIVTNTNGTLDKTWQEIYNVAQTNEVVLINVEQQKIIQKRMEFIDSSKGYIVEFSVNVQFVAVTANDYPTFNS